jgi:predicted nucleic acid-binding protein
VIYLGTSYLTKIYTAETGSAEVVAWMTGQRGFVCCQHGRLELIASFKRHQREGHLSARDLATLVQRLESDETIGHLAWLPIDLALIRRAGELVASCPPAIFLRAADALHLACAADAGLKEIYSHDRHLLAAAPHFGLRGRDVISPKTK